MVDDETHVSNQCHCMKSLLSRVSFIDYEWIGSTSQEKKKKERPSGLHKAWWPLLSLNNYNADEMCLYWLIKSHWIMQSTTKSSLFSKRQTLIDPQNYASPSCIVNGTVEAGKPSSNLQDCVSSKKVKGEFRDVLGHAGTKYHRKERLEVQNDGIWFWHWFSPSKMKCLATMNVFRDAISVIHHEPTFRHPSPIFYPSIDITSYHKSSAIHLNTLLSRSIDFTGQFAVCTILLMTLPNFPQGISVVCAFCEILVWGLGVGSAKVDVSSNLPGDESQGSQVPSYWAIFWRLNHLFWDSFSYRTNPFEMNWKLQMAHQSRMNTFHLYIYIFVTEIYP